MAPPAGRTSVVSPEKRTVRLGDVTEVMHSQTFKGLNRGDSTRDFRDFSPTKLKHSLRRRSRIKHIASTGHRRARALPPLLH